MAGFAAFALLGLFGSLVPGFLASVLHQGSHAMQGAVVFLLFAVGTVTQVALSRFGSRLVVLAWPVPGCAGPDPTALADSAMAPFLAGTVVGGTAVGAIFLGSLATANRLAPPRAARSGHIRLLCGVLRGLIIPVVGVGVLSGFIGIFLAVLAFSLLLAVLCLFSVESIRRTR